jgi:YD repeat-containing protein
MVGLWAAAMLLACLPACGSSSPKCTTNCAEGGTGGSGSGGSSGSGGTHDAAADHGNTGGAQSNDGASDGRRDAKEPVDQANSCAQSLTAACSATHDAGSFSVHCASTWDATTRNAYLCARPLTTVLITTCGDYQELTDVANNGSEEYVYVYDAAGNLVAVSHVQYQEGGADTQCIGGSAGFVDPQGCSAPTAFSCPKDGGTHG